MSESSDLAPQYDRFLAAVHFVADSVTDSADVGRNDNLVDPRAARLLLEAGAMVPQKVAEIAEPVCPPPVLRLVSE